MPFINLNRLLVHFVAESVVKDAVLDELAYYRSTFPQYLFRYRHKVNAARVLFRFSESSLLIRALWRNFDFADSFIPISTFQSSFVLSSDQIAGPLADKVRLKIKEVATLGTVEIWKWGEFITLSIENELMRVVIIELTA